MSGHTPGPLPKILRTEECAAGSRYAVGVHSGEVLFNDRAAFAAEIARRWNAHADLVAACEEAIRLTTDHLANDDAPRGLDAATARNLRHICRAAIAKAGGA